MASIPNIKQGAKKALKIKLITLQHIQNEIQALQSKMYYVEDLATEFIVEVTALKNAVNAKIAKLQEQITDENFKKLNNPFIKFWKNTIEPNCSEALREFRSIKKVLYRGIRNAPAYEFIAKSREDRLPLDSSRASQDLFDEILIKLGMSAIRSNSIFSTTNISQASNYGRLYVIIPVNGFNFTYTKEDDFHIHLDELVSAKKIKKIKQLITKVGGDSDRYEFEDLYNLEILDELKRDFKNIPKLNNLTPIDLVDLNEIKKKLAPSNTKLQTGMKNGVEILVHGTYYAFKVEIYKEILELLLGVKIESY